MSEVLIIGSGLGGLECGALLSQEGIRVIEAQVGAHEQASGHTPPLELEQGLHEDRDTAVGHEGDGDIEGVTAQELCRQRREDVFRRLLVVSNELRHIGCHLMGASVEKAVLEGPEQVLLDRGQGTFDVVAKGANVVAAHLKLKLYVVHATPFPDPTVRVQDSAGTENMTHAIHSRIVWGPERSNSHGRQPERTEKAAMQTA